MNWVSWLMDRKKKPIWDRWPARRALRGFFDMTRKFGINPAALIAPAILSFLSAFADGVSVGLLIPVVQGVISKNFSFVFQKPVLRELVGILPPDLSKNNAAILGLLVLWIFLFSVIKNVLAYAQMLITSYQIREFANKTRKLVHERYLSFGKMFFDRTSFGHLHQVLIGYTAQISQEFQNLQTAVFQFFSLIIYLAVGFLISWKLMLFTGVVFPTLHFSLRALIRRIKQSSERFSIIYSEMGTKISNSLSCIMLVKAYANEEREKQWFNYVSDRVRDIQYSIDKKQRIIGPFQEIVGLFMTLFLVVFMAFLLRHDGGDNLAGFMVFFIVARRASQNFGVFSWVQSTLAGIWGPLQEIKSILNDKDKYFIPEGARLLDRFQEKIEIKQLDFSYVEKRPILKQISFSIKKGEMLAIVGPSGSGKTTIVNLLMRFYDSAPGSILIDGTDIRDFTIQSLRGKIALVSQDTLLLNASFKINLLYGLNREISDSELDHVLELARLRQLVKLIGIDAQLGERGVKLSGGERQRVSIARAILKKPEILLLDEATSALDTATEGLIQSALAEATKNKTVIVIAHRLSTIKNSNKIVVMDDGIISEEGTLAELLARKGKFYQLWEAQRFF